VLELPNEIASENRTLGRERQRTTSPKFRTSFEAAERVPNEDVGKLGTNEGSTVHGAGECRRLISQVHQK